MAQKVYDVIVIGAGISGLYTAYNLEKSGLSTLTLEGRDRIAGRQYTKWDDEVDYVDLGGAYVGKQQEKIFEVMNELGLEPFHPLDLKLDALMFSNGKALRFNKFYNVLPTYNPFVLMDINNIMRTLDNLSKQVNPVEPWTAPLAHYWDTLSAEDFINMNCWTSFAKDVMSNALRCIFGAEPKNLSLLYVLNLIRATGGIIALTETKNGLQEYKIKGGSGSISKRLAERLQGPIRLNTGVTKVVQDGEGVKVYTEKNEIFKAKRVAVCVGLTMLSVLKFEPPLPKYVTEMTDSGKIGVPDYGFKTIVYYKSRFWTDKGLSGEMSSDQGLVTYALDDTKPDGSHPAIMGFVTADRFIEIAKGSPERRKQMICEQYASHYGLEEFLHPINYREKHWQDTEEMRWGRGICVYSHPPGVLTKYKRCPGETHGLVYFASTELAQNMTGYMDGALRRAQKTATEILRDFGKEVEDDPLSANFVEIPYQPRPLVEKILPSVPQFLIISAVVIAALTAFIANHLW